MGPIRGKVDPIVGYTWKGQCVIRSLSKKISKAPSQKQLDNRKKIAAYQDWLMFTTPFVRIVSKITQQNSMALGMLYPTLN